jgi:hypothetical protein
MLLTLLPTIFQPLAMYKTFAEGLLLVLFFLYLPQGLFGVIAKQIDRIRFRRSEPREVRAVLVGEQEG